jgi:phage host-nuclease inhibitor protein Gam
MGDAQNVAAVVEWMDGLVDSQEKADEHLEELANIHRITRENLALTNAACERLRARCEATNAPLEKRAAYLEGHLRVWSEANRAELLKGLKTKSRRFPHGRIGWRESGGTLVVKDEAVLTGWAVDNGMAKPTADLKRIREYVKTKGVVPDGADVTPREDKLFIETEEE